MRGWLTALSLLLLASDATAAELRLAYIDQDVPPFFAGNGPDIPARPGVVIELVRHLLKDTGFTPVLTRLPGRRLQDEIRAGRQDGLIGTRYTPERAQVMAYPLVDGHIDPQRQLANVGYYLYSRKVSGIAWDGRDMRGMHVGLGIPSGVTAVQKLPGITGITTVEAPTSLQLFRMLAFGRVDAVITIGQVGDRFVGRLEGVDVVKLSPALLMEDFYIPFTHGFHARNRDFVEDFWRRLARDRDAVFHALLADYGFSP
ncbi:MAG: transporter substrate-binding domain-containing protein [Ferrovibrio sp.]